MDPSALCLACGLCCDGTLFADVRLSTEENTNRLRAVLGLEEKADRFRQPCPALGADCRCRIYADRPTVCRRFDCALLRATLAGQREVDSALRQIAEARHERDTVRRLLRRLGDADETTALSLRFQRMEQRFHSSDLPAVGDAESAWETFAELKLAVARLQTLLRAHFYLPADGVPSPTDTSSD